MDASGAQEYDRVQELKKFDETKAGVKGLIDSGLQKIPKIFVRPAEELAEDLNYKNKRAQIEVPVIDLGDLEKTHRHKKIVEEVRIASETWGFFQVVNHGISLHMLDEMLDAIQKFNEQDVEEKKKYYTRDNTRTVRFNSNNDLFKSRTASWRDTLGISFSAQINSDDLPILCRKSAIEYSKLVNNLGNILLGLLSEALGLEPEHLRNMECSDGHHLSCHYYPACPEPELTMGTAKHSDAGFLTILLQNQIDGLQIFFQNQWIDVQPVRGAFVINIGDLLQVVSNGKFRSNKHRVVANRLGPRISIACFLSGPINKDKVFYGPIKELISEESPPVYKEVLLNDYITKFITAALDENFLDNYCKK